MGECRNQRQNTKKPNSERKGVLGIVISGVNKNERRDKGLKHVTRTVYFTYVVTYLLVLRERKKKKRILF